MQRLLSHNNAAPVRKSGFTLIELLVVIAIIAILAAILFPVFARARENAHTYNGVAPFHTSYIYNAQMGFLSGGTTWMGISIAKVQNPAGTVTFSDGGVQASATAPFVTTTVKPSSYLLFDPTTDASGTMSFGPSNAQAARNRRQLDRPNARHLETTNVAFADGHVKSLRVEKFYTGNSPWLDPARGGP